MNKREKLKTAMPKVLEILEKMSIETIDQIPEEMLEKMDPLILLAGLVATMELKMYGQKTSVHVPKSNESSESDKGFFEIPKAPKDLKKDYKNFN